MPLWAGLEKSPIGGRSGSDLSADDNGANDLGSIVTQVRYFRHEMQSSIEWCWTLELDRVRLGHPRITVYIGRTPVPNAHSIEDGSARVAVEQCADNSPSNNFDTRSVYLSRMPLSDHRLIACEASETKISLVCGATAETEAIGEPRFLQRSLVHRTSRRMKDTTQSNRASERVRQAAHMCRYVRLLAVGRLQGIRFKEHRGFDLKDTIMWAYHCICYSSNCSC